MQTGRQARAEESGGGSEGRDLCCIGSQDANLLLRDARLEQTLQVLAHRKCLALVEGRAGSGLLFSHITSGSVDEAQGAEGLFCLLHLRQVREPVLAYLVGRLQAPSVHCLRAAAQTRVRQGFQGLGFGV